MLRFCTALAALVFVLPAAAQTPFRALHAPDGNVRDAAIAGDTLYVAGDFASIGQTTGGTAALNKQTGVPDANQARVASEEFGDEARVILPDGAGGYYLGGEITYAGGQPRRNLAHVLADGSLDPDFHPDPIRTINEGYAGSVSALALAPARDGQPATLFVGGRFDEIGGEPRRNLGAVDAATGAVLPFSVTMTDDYEGGGDHRGYIYHLLYHDGTLYADGYYDTFNGEPRPEDIIALDPLSGATLPWRPAINGGARMVGLGDGTLYIRGSFTTVAGQPQSGWAEVSLADPVTGEGGAPTAWRTPGPPYITYDYEVDRNYIWAVSNYYPNLYRMSRTTGAVSEHLRNTPYRSGSHLALDPTGGPTGEGVVYVATHGGISGDPFPTKNIVAVDARTGNVLTSVFNGGDLRLLAGRTDFGPRDMVVEPGPDGRLLIAGELYGVRGEPRRFLGGVDLTTGQTIPFGYEYIIASSVTQIAISPDDRFLYFSTYNGLGVADLRTGVITNFPAARLAETLDDMLGADRAAPGDSSLVQRPGPAVTRRDGRPVEAFQPPPRAPASSRAGGSGRSVRGGHSSLIATEDRLYSTPLGAGVICYDRFTGEQLYVTQFSAFDPGPNRARALLVEAGPPGAAGDTLFVSGNIFAAEGLPRDLFVAVDAETGDVLDWRVYPASTQGRGAGRGMAALPDDGRLFLGGFDFETVSGEDRVGLFAVGRSSAVLAPWTPNPLRRTSYSVGAIAAQPGPDGRADVVYASSVRHNEDYGGISPAGAFDGTTGARLDEWNPVIGEGSPNVITLDAERGWVILSGSFTSSLRGDGSAFLLGVTPAQSFAVAGEPGSTEAPRSASLALAGPNPLRTRTALAVSLPEAQAVEAALYDVLGRRVAVLHAGPLPAGVSRIDVDASALPAGVYVARVVGGAFAEALRLTVVR